MTKHDEDIDDGYPEDGYDYNEPKPNGLMLQLNGTLDFVISFCGYWFGRAVESFEWLGSNLFEFACLAIMPWRWFKPKQRPIDDNAEMADVVRSQDQGSLIDSTEYLGGHLLAVVGLFFVSLYRRLIPKWLGEGIEFVFAHIFGSIGYGLNMIGRILLPQKLVEATQVAEIALTETTIGFFARFGQTAVQLAERIFPRRFFWPFYWLAGVTLSSLFSLADFLAQWWYSRDFMRLLFAAPAIVLIFVSSVTLIQGSLYSNQHKIYHYQEKLQEAEEADELETALLYRNKLSQLGYKHLKDVKFANALNLVENGDFEEGRAAMEKLAPLEAGGYWGAHLWLATMILEGEIEYKDAWRIIEKHTDHALAEEPDNVLGKRLRAEILLQKGQIDDAIELMDELRRAYPELNAILCHLYNTKGDTVKTKFHANQAVGFYNEQQAKRAESPGDDGEFDELTPLGFLRTAEAHAIVGKPRVAAELLKQGLRKFPDNPMIKKGLVDSLLRDIASKQDLSDPTTQEHVETLCQFAPEHPILMAILLRGILSEDAAGIALVERLDQEGVLATQVFERLGDMYLAGGKHAEAVQQYQRAIRKNPEASYAWNNMAWIWGNQAPVDLDKALSAADQAIKLNPDPRFYETRGQIKIKLKRWRDAIDDLETALNGTIPNAKQVHADIARCYEQLGDQEQASAHRKMAA